METIKITGEQAFEMQQPFLKSATKKRLGITGYQFLKGWEVISETYAAYKIRGLNETGTAVKREIEEIFTWIPKSQTKIFESPDDDEMGEYGERLIFLKTWLYNKNKNELKLNEFANIVY